MDNTFVGDSSADDSPNNFDNGTDERGGIVTARGTGDGLILRLDGRVEESSLRSALEEFINSRTGFLRGNEVSIEWVGTKPSEIFVRSVTELLTDNYGIKVRSSKMRDMARVVPEESSKAASSRHLSLEPSAHSDPGKPLGLFGGVEAIRTKDVDFDSRLIEPGSSGGSDAILWDDPDARIVYATLRSGQRIETEHSLVIVGDINCGAEVVAGGDIIVLGTLRGVAHAGAFDETGGGRFIFALSLRPTQLRIGSIISRGAAENERLPEVAKVEGNLIVVEPYQSKNMIVRRGS